MLHPYTSRTAAQNRADSLTESTGDLHTIELAPLCAHKRVEAWSVVGPRVRSGRPPRVDRRIYGVDTHKAWASELVALIDEAKLDAPPAAARWRALIAPRRRGEPDESARHTVRVVLRLSPEHARRLRALSQGDPLSRLVEGLIDKAWDGRGAT